MKAREPRHAAHDRIVLANRGRPARFGAVTRVAPQTHGDEPWFLCDVIMDDGEPINGLADYELRTPAEHATKSATLRP